MIKLCGLWKRKTKEEKTFYVGDIDVLGISVFIFQNKSDHPKSPVLDLFIARKEPKEKKELSDKDTDDKDWDAENDIPF